MSSLRSTPTWTRPPRCVAWPGWQEIPDGARFEAFAYLDRFLGLDLARDVGR